MLQPCSSFRSLLACLALFATVNSFAGTACADPEPATAVPLPEVLTRDVAVSWALQNNPELATLRQQHGIAAAAVVIARTYPFNPLLENRVQDSSGPVSAGITNRVPLEHLLLWEVELRGQGKYRRQAAAAALSRTDWEIAFQEAALAVHVIRAFDAVLYRREKLALIESTINLEHQSVLRLTELRKAGKLLQPDLILARTEEEDARGQTGTGRTNLSIAESELRRGLGVVGGSLSVQGTLIKPEQPWQADTLIPVALERRPDLHARQAALAEAEASVRLAIADRYGNPTLGPAYTYDPTRVHEIGGQLNIPLPIFNTHRGEIKQREAERDRVRLELQQTDVAIRQDIFAALDRLRNGREWASKYEKEILPHLETALKDMQSLFEQSQADVLRVVNVLRKLIRARDVYLDALWEVSQAQADLAAALGDPSLASAP